MSNKMWDVLVEHAKTCVLSGKHYIYYSDETKTIGAIFNNIYEFTGLIASGQYVSAESLNENQKVYIVCLFGYFLIASFYCSNALSVVNDMLVEVS